MPKLQGKPKSVTKPVASLIVQALQSRNYYFKKWIDRENSDSADANVRWYAEQQLLKSEQLIRKSMRAYRQNGRKII